MPLLSPPKPFVGIVFKCLRAAIVTNFVVLFFALAEAMGGRMAYALWFSIQDATCLVATVLVFPLLAFILLFIASGQWRSFGQTLILLALVLFVGVASARFASV